MQGRQDRISFTCVDSQFVATSLPMSNQKWVIKFSVAQSSELAVRYQNTLSAIVKMSDAVIISLQLTLKLLNAYNLKVDTANTGRKALAALTGQQYSLVPMDSNLPDTNGIYFIDQTCNKDGLNRGTPVIILSGIKDRATVGAALKRGAKGYILKPLFKASVVK